MATKHYYKYIEGIRNNDNKVITEMIKDFRPRIIAFLRSKGVEKSTTKIAEDFFFEGVLILIDRVLADASFNLTDKKLYYYLQRIAYNNWIDTIHGADRDTKMVDELLLLTEDDLEAIENKNAEQKAFNAGFNQLSQDCQEVLECTFVYKIPDKEIAEEKGYAGDFVRQKRRRCIQKLKKILNR